MSKIFSFFTVLFLVITSSVFALGVDDAMDVSAQGVLVQKFRLQLIAKNVANAYTMMTDKGIPYTKQYPLIVSDGRGVRVTGIGESDEPFGKAFDPSHPFSDKYGYVYLPNVNLSEEMVDMAYTHVLYEANTTVFKSARSMYQNTLDILK